MSHLQEVIIKGGIHLLNKDQTLDCWSNPSDQLVNSYESGVCVLVEGVEGMLEGQPLHQQLPYLFYAKALMDFLIKNSSSNVPSCPTSMETLVQKAFDMFVFDMQDHTSDDQFAVSTNEGICPHQAASPCPAFSNILSHYEKLKNVRFQISSQKFELLLSILVFGLTKFETFDLDCEQFIHGCCGCIGEMKDEPILVQIGAKVDTQQLQNGKEIFSIVLNKALQYQDDPESE